MSELQGLLSRLWADLVARPAGPLEFRFLLQPLIAAVFAVRDGVSDARARRSPYFWTLVHDPAHRRERFGEGVRATVRVVLLGVAIDALYQFQVHGTVYPGEALGIALPGSASAPAVTADRIRIAERSGAQAVAMFSHVVRPPRRRGITWSKVSSLCVPQ